MEQPKSTFKTLKELKEEPKTEKKKPRNSYVNPEEARLAQLESQRKWRNKQKELYGPEYYKRYKVKKCPICVVHMNSSESTGFECEICKQFEEVNLITWNTIQNYDPDETYDDFPTKLLNSLKKLPDFNLKMLAYYSDFYQEMKQRTKIDNDQKYPQFQPNK